MFLIMFRNWWKITMSYRECDYIYVRHLCDEWLSWYHEGLSKHQTEYNESKKWYNLSKEAPYFFYTRYKSRVEAIRTLVNMDGGLNRIVNLSAEDAYLLSFPRIEK